MTAPDNVPVPLAERPRRSLAIPPPRRWQADRPGDLERGQPRGPRLGSPGPDQGYALNLAERFADRVHTTKGEHTEDALVGCTAVALRRASLFGRAPVIHDLELALTLWGFLDADAPTDLVEFRRSHFAGAAHHYWDQRDVTDLVPETTLRMTAAQVKSRLSDWRTLFAV